jgi:methionyl-tRNA formyltransferase
MSTPISTTFFGTHTFASTILQALLDAPNISVDLVITQPDKPVGRKKIMTPPPVKVLAEKHNIKVDQPPSLKVYELGTRNLELGVTAQYGLLIPPHILDSFPHGILNVHTSLLPKYRGASPIQSVLINGDTETGVTIMKMEEGLDTGPILLQKSIVIKKDDMYLDLDTKLAKIGSQALIEAIPQYIDGSLVPAVQDDAEATHCKQFKREDGKIDWTKTTEQIYNQYRGMHPWPGVFTSWNNKRLKLLQIQSVEGDLPAGKVAVEDAKLYVGCSSGAVEVIELQLEGKKPMDVKTFLNGFAQFENSQLR